MAEPSRFPQGLFPVGDGITVAKPIGTLIAIGGLLYMSTHATVATFGIIGGRNVGISGSVIADPGTGVAIPVTDSGNCALTIGTAAETNTLAIPTSVGQRLVLTVAAAGGGTRTVTVASAINVAGNTTIALTNAADYTVLEGVNAGGVLAWRVIVNDGSVLA